MIIINGFEYIDEQALIESFRDLMKPKSGNNFSEYSNGDSYEFASIMEWLYKNNFIIREFPNAIQRKMTLKSFGSDTIRNHILKHNPNLQSVPWSDRRAVIDSLTIERKYDDPSFEVKEGIDDIMKEIAMGTGSFQGQTKENKLALLNNCVEHLLKQGKKFKKIDSSIFYNFLEEKDVIQFRLDTHVFRHHDVDAMASRALWSDQKKDFYIRLGIIMITQVFKDNYYSL